MPLPAPNLDDRRFQDILDEARRMIPRYCPEWTDHNLSDPGITLLELFAWMTDMLLYRLNRVPDKNYIKFLDLIGVRLEPAKAASADITFRLSAPQPGDVVIPRGTAVSTVRTETRDSITFTTDRNLPIRVPQLRYILACRGGTRFHDYRPAVEDPRQGLGVFGDPPQEDDGLYLGFANDLSAHILAITLHCRIEGIGVDPNDPPLVWETWDRLEGKWVRLRLDQDTTGGLNRDGVVVVHTPYAAGLAVVDEKEAFWVRCRVLRPRPGQAFYSDSPRITALPLVESIGGLVPASHAFVVEGELLGVSDGTPGQTFRLQNLPVLPRQPGETIEVEDGAGGWEPWVEVRDFGSSSPDDPHFVLDDVTGTVEFGPRVRTPSGDERQYGRVPPQGRRIRFSRYRSGGGTAGNVGAGTLTVLKSSIPYVAEVTNFAPATGGQDPEDLEHAKLRAPRELRAQERAVTAEDFEHLARRASPLIGRVHCQPVRGSTSAAGDGASPGVVRLLLVPTLDDALGPLAPERLQLPAHVLQQVQEYLDERRLLTCELVLAAPTYAWVSVAARLRARPRADRTRVQREALEALYRFLHPLCGGPDGQGWPFGRELFLADIFAVLQRIEDVDVVEEAALYQVNPFTGETGQPVGRVAPGAGGLICSHEHRIEVQ
jgi:predicted phage baseplate assembly protein